MTEGAKAVVTVSEMARLVGLSRARFYQLQKAGVFPGPVYDVATRRPVYTEELQSVCLEVRRRNCGADGKPVLFYARRAPFAKPQTRRKKGAARPPKNEHPDLLAAMHGLGLASVTAARVGEAVRELFPRGTAGVEEAEVVRAVFLYLRRKDSGGKAGK
jgi:hypothetical protein